MLHVVLFCGILHGFMNLRNSQKFGVFSKQVKFMAYGVMLAEHFLKQQCIKSLQFLYIAKQLHNVNYS